MTTETESNINFFFDEIDDNNLELDLSELLNELEEIELEDNYEEKLMPEIINYEVNYNIKQLLLICEYYKISKILKTNKCNKADIIKALVFFENDSKNYELVLKRKQMWFLMNELKNDKFMKKYIFFYKLVFHFSFLLFYLT
jgi:hypothetical protein